MSLDKTKNEFTIPKSIDEDVYKILVPIFIQELKADFESLYNTYKDLDSKTTNLVAHKIHGTADAYGALKVASIAKEIELKSDENLEQQTIRVSELRENIAKFVSLVNKKYDLNC